MRKRRPSRRHCLVPLLTLGCLPAACHSSAHSPLRVIETTTTIFVPDDHTNTALTLWNKRKRHGGDWLHEMAEAVRRQFYPWHCQWPWSWRRPCAPWLRGLNLGFGAGVGAAELLCDGHTAALWGVELDTRFLDVARRRFLPLIFGSASCRPDARAALRTVKANATALVAEWAARRRNLSAADAPPAPFDYLLLDYPPIYEHPDAVPLSFWRQLRELATPGALLVVNTDMRAADGAKQLAARLAASGWAQSRIHTLQVHATFHSRVLIATTTENPRGVAHLPSSSAVTVVLRFGLLLLGALGVSVCCFFVCSEQPSDESPEWHTDQDLIQEIRAYSRRGRYRR